MVLNEFLFDLDVANDFLEESTFIDLIAQTANIAQNAVSGAIPDWRSELDAQLTRLDEYVYGFETERPTLLIENTYLKMTDEGSVLYNYRSILEEIFQNILTAVTRINELSENLRTFATHTKQVLSGLGVVGIEAPEEEEHDGQLVRFEFKDGSDFNTLRELGTVGRNLNVHIRSLVKIDPEATMPDIEFHTISKSSPFNLSAWLTKNVANAINTIIGGGLDNFKKVQEIQVLREDVKRAKIGTRSDEVDLILKEAKAGLELRVIEKITDQLMVNYPDEGPNGTKAEVGEGVKKAVEYLVAKTSQGMEVKVIPAQAEMKSSDHGREIIEQYSQQKTINEEIMKQIPQSVNDTEEEVQEHDSTQDEPDEDGLDIG